MAFQIVRLEDLNIFSAICSKFWKNNMEEKIMVVNPMTPSCTEFLKNDSKYPVMASVCTGMILSKIKIWILAYWSSKTGTLAMRLSEIINNGTTVKMV